MLRSAEYAQRTDTGRQRNANEDSLYVRPPVFVVADGMGGAQAGEVASKTAADAFERGVPDGAPEVVLRQVIEEANREIYDKARRDPSIAGMGTTITAAIIDSEAESVAIGHVGDSRAYRFRAGRLERLTRDHSLVEEMRRKGQITDEQAEEHPQRSIITRALGPEPHVEVDVQSVAALSGDVFLLCSDGLTTMVGEDRIAQILLGAGSLDDAVRALVAEANDQGGRDNITAVAFRLEDPTAPVQEPDDRPTLIGSAAAEEGLTTDEVRRAAAAQRATARPAQPRRTRTSGEHVVASEPPRRRGRTALKALLGLLIVAAVLVGGWYASRQVWFLGTDSGGRVALYRGLPYELPLGIDLYDKHYASPLQTDTLSRRRQEAVTDHELRSRDDAESLIEDIERSAARNAQPEPKPEPEPEPEPAPQPVPEPDPQPQPERNGQNGSAGGAGTQ